MEVKVRDVTIALVWFRRDFRLRDNAALRFAAAHAQRIVPVYIHDAIDESPWAPGAASRWWLERSIIGLRDALHKRGLRLILRRGPARAALARLARETEATLLVFNRLYEPAWTKADRPLASEMRALGLATHSFPGALLFEPEAVANASGAPYRVFTPYARACLRAGEIAPPAPAPRVLKAPKRWPASEELASFSLRPAIKWYGQMEKAWQPGEAGALKRLKRLQSGVLDRYVNERDLPAAEGVSRLSPHLHFGEITPRQLWRALDDDGRRRAPGRARAVEAYRRQLLWREFAHHLLHHFPKTPHAPLRAEFEAWPWRRSYGGLLRAWQHGRTGFPIIDAGMRELWTTGFMHNRVRMLVASFLVKNLNIPWQQGARWFWDTLVDADLANNTLGWQWTAGCGADAAPYFRIFNPVVQGKRFDAHGRYVRKWVAELASLPDLFIHEPWRARSRDRERLGFTPGQDYPRPIVDFARTRAAALRAYGNLRKKKRG